MAPIGVARPVILGNVEAAAYYPRLDSGRIPDYLYVPETFNDASNIWEDYMGNGNSTASRGNPTYVTRNAGNGANITECVQGNTSAGLRFSGRLVADTSYTLFHVARYNGAERRIFDAEGSNWLSGFWNGRTPVAYHNGWLTDQSDRAGTNWVVSCDMYSFYRGYWTNGSGGYNSYSRTGGGSQTETVSLNYGYFGGERSDWQVYGIWFYNVSLSSTERDIVQTHIAELVGLGTV